MLIKRLHFPIKKFQNIIKDKNIKFSKKINLNRAIYLYYKFSTKAIMHFKRFKNRSYKTLKNILTINIHIGNPMVPININ